MTYHDDKNLSGEINQQRRGDMNRTRISPWVWGGLAAVLLALAFMFMPGNHNTGQSTAQRPAVTTPSTTAPARETTGSGVPSSTIPNNPNGTAPQRDTNQPAPAASPTR